MKAEEREILNLRILKGYSITETASILGKNEMEVRSGQYRAMYSLAQRLKQRDSRE